MVFAVVPSPALSASNPGHSGAKTALAVTYIAKIVSSITTLSSPSIALRFVSPTPFERLTKYARSDGMGSSSTKCSLVRSASRYSSVTLWESHAHTPQKNTSSLSSTSLVSTKWSFSTVRATLVMSPLVAGNCSTHCGFQQHLFNLILYSAFAFWTTFISFRWRTR